VLSDTAAKIFCEKVMPIKKFSWILKFCYERNYDVGIQSTDYLISRRDVRVQIGDMMSFMVIMTVFILSYGVASQVILYPNSQLNIHLFVDLLDYSWWSVFGEFNIKEVTGQ